MDHQPHNGQVDQPNSQRELPIVQGPSAIALNHALSAGSPGQRAKTLAHVQIVNHQHNLDPFEKKITYKSNRVGIAERFEHPSVQASINLDLKLLTHYDDAVRELERFLEQNAKLDDPQNFFRLRTIPGVGRQQPLEAKPTREFTQGEINSLTI